MKKKDISREDTGRQAGFTLLEVIVAISILTVGLLAVASMQVSAIYGNAMASKQTEATTVAQEKLEELLSLSYTMTSVPTALEDNETFGGSHIVPQADLPSGYTQIRWDVTNNTDQLANTKTITVTVTWTNKGFTKSTSLSSYMAIS